MWKTTDLMGTGSGNQKGNSSQEVYCQFIVSVDIIYSFFAELFYTCSSVRPSYAYQKESGCLTSFGQI